MLQERVNEKRLVSVQRGDHPNLVEYGVPS